MNKLFILILLFFSSDLFADWTYLIENKGENDIHYIDINTIERHKNLVKMWILQDYKTVVDGNVLSDMFLYEYDCSNGSARLLYLKSFSGHMGKGRIILDGDFIPTESKKFYYQEKNTVGSLRAKIACNHK